MSLHLYEYDSDNNEYLVVSEDGLQTSPVRTSHNGTNGEIVEQKLFLRNDDANFYYTIIRMQPVPLRKTRVGDINYPEAFVGFKILVQDGQPTESEWLAVKSGIEVDVADIGTTTAGDISHKPLWVQVSLPAGTRVQTIRDVSISINTEVNPVGS